MPKKPKCKTCKGNGYVYPVVNDICDTCWNHEEDKKTCDDCKKTGWVKKTQTELCGNCGGKGYLDEEDMY